MRTFIMTFLLVLCAASQNVSGAGVAEALVPGDSSRFHLFLLAGQSNMSGRGKVKPQDLKPHDRVVMLNQNNAWVPAIDPLHFDKPNVGVGLGKTFAIDYLNQHPGVTVGLIPCAVGGSPISSWKPNAKFAVTGTFPYDDAIRRVKSALECGTLKGILWHQGESDSKPSLAKDYEQNLHELIARFRKEFGMPNLPFVAGQMGQFKASPWSKSKKIVDAAHRSLPEKVRNTGCVSSDGLSHKGDNLHFDAYSCRELGHRYYKVFQTILAGKAKALPPAEANSRVTGSPLKAAKVRNLDSQRKPNLEFASRIQELLAATQETSYQHHTEIDEQNGVLHCDCSGFVGFLLRHEFPEHYVSLDGDEAPWRKRPVATTFYETFIAAGESNNHRVTWQRIPKMMNVLPGDVLAWRKKTIKRGSTTGHVCVIASTPVKQKDGTVRIQIIDSTSVPHENDTRPGGNGVGTGERFFLVNSQGEPIGFLRRGRLERFSIAMGRMLDIVPPEDLSTELPATETSDFAFIGLQMIEAVKLAEVQNLEWRIIRKDGRPTPVGWLIRDERLNFVIEKGKIVDLIRG